MLFGSLKGKLQTYPLFAEFEVPPHWTRPGDQYHGDRFVPLQAHLAEYQAVLRIFLDTKGTYSPQVIKASDLLSTTRLIRLFLPYQSLFKPVCLLTIIAA